MDKDEFKEFYNSIEKFDPLGDNIITDPDFFNIINREFDKKITGEVNSRKAIFLSLCSIWVDDVEVPLHSLVSSQSSTGKSFVCKNIVKIFPKELVVWRSKISAEAFTYWKANDPNWTWDNRVLYLEDISQNLLDSETFRVMCSEGSIATVVKNQRAIDLEVNGKPVILVTTASTNPSSEVLNRFSIIQLDETSKQTKAITKAQAEQYLVEEYNPKVIDALRQLKPKKCYIPFANQIQKYLENNYTFEDIRLRRDFPRILTLINCSTTFHQYQRKEIEGRLYSEEQDYKIAREVINYISRTTLKGLTHKLKKAYDCCIKEEEFTAKNIHSKYPFVSQKMWYHYLDKLCERNLLTTELKSVEGVKQEVTFFQIKDKISFNLPTYKDLINTTIVKIDKIDKKDKKVTKDTKDNKKSSKKGKEQLKQLKPFTSPYGFEGGKKGNKLPRGISLPPPIEEVVK